MFKTFLATTALTTMLAGSAFADQHMQAADGSAQIFDRTMENSVTMDDNGIYSAQATHILTSNLVGSNIYNGVGEDAEVIGDVNNVIIAPNGDAVAVVAGVGGFLGLGEKDVAIAFDKLTWKATEDGDRWIVSSLTKEQLEAAPAFDYEALEWKQTALVDTDENTQTMKKADDTEMAAAPAPAEAEAETDPIQTAATEDTYVPLAAEQISADKLIGMNVIGADGDDLGEVGDVIIGENEAVKAVIIDVGGFLGINEKPVAVSLDSLMIARADGMLDWSNIKADLTEDQLRDQEAYTQAAYEAEGDAIILVAPAPAQ